MVHLPHIVMVQFDVALVSMHSWWKMTYSTIRVLTYVALAIGLNITDPGIYGALLVCLLLFKTH